MEQTVPCPGCAAAMGLDQEVCGACRRPRDEMEIEKGRDLIKELAEKRRRRPMMIARRLLAAVALVLALQHRTFFIDQALALRAEMHDGINQELKGIQHPEEAPGATAPTTPAGAAVIATLGIPPAAQRTEVVSTHASPATAARPARASAPSAVTPPSEAPRIAVRPDEPGEPQTGFLRVYGIVYDMKTLQPIPNAVVTLTVPPPGNRIETDADGHYQIDFSPHSVINVPDRSVPLISAGAAGYREGQIEDLDPPYLLWPLKKRLEHIAELGPGDLDAVPLLHRSNETIIPLDLVLIPEDAPASK